MAGSAGASNTAGSAGRGAGAGGGSSGGLGGGANAGDGAGATTAGEAGALAGGSAGGSDCGGEDCNQVPPGLLDPERTTEWNPGILSDDQGQRELGPDGVPVRTTVCATPLPGDDIQAAIDACPEGQVVELRADEYTISATLRLTKGVVLRGQGSLGAEAGGTTIVRTGGGGVLSIGTDEDQACYGSAHGTAHALAEDALKETRTIQLAEGASDFEAGDLALIDVADDDEVDAGDCVYFKRVEGRSLSQRVLVESVDSAANTVTLATPLHFTFRAAAPHSAELAKVTQAVTRYAGIEGMLLQGGSNPDYNGKNAGGIEVSNAVNCWIKDVQTDGTIDGMHVALTGAYRTVVRDSYFHHSATYGFGEDCYGIVLRCGAADNLVENNIARYMNKPILFNVSGGGNVIAYNYTDNSWATPAAWQEVNIDTHCSFPHMELMEGNYAPHMGATITHGNAGYLTYFRNYSSSQFAPPAVANATEQQTGNVAAIQFGARDIKMTLVGNVLGSSAATDLGTAAVTNRYISSDTGASNIIVLDPDYMSDVSFTTLWLHGNYDTESMSVRWDPNNDVREIPASLYLSRRPSFWPSDEPWPWVGPDLDPMVGTLPAKARAEALE
jgi:hypothetical protein